MQGLNLGAVGVETDRRGFIPVDEKMQVLGKDGKAVPHVYCIGDANGAPPTVWELMLAKRCSRNQRISSMQVLASHIQVGCHCRNCHGGRPQRARLPATNLFPGPPCC